MINLCDTTNTTDYVTLSNGIGMNPIARIHTLIILLVVVIIRSARGLVSDK